MEPGGRRTQPEQAADEGKSLLGPPLGRLLTTNKFASSLTAANQTKNLPVNKGFYLARRELFLAESRPAGFEPEPGLIRGRLKTPAKAGAEIQKDGLIMNLADSLKPAANPAASAG